MATASPHASRKNERKKIRHGALRLLPLRIVEVYMLVIS